MKHQRFRSKGIHWQVFIFPNKSEMIRHYINKTKIDDRFKAAVQDWKRGALLYFYENNTINDDIVHEAYHLVESIKKLTSCRMTEEICAILIEDIVKKIRDLNQTS